jgi:hypothetical protein
MIYAYSYVCAKAGEKNFAGIGVEKNFVDVIREGRE